MKKEVLLKAIGLYQSGLSFKEISEQLKVSTGSLCRHFKKHGVTVRNNGGKYPVDVDAAQKLYDEGLSLREVARRLGYKSENTIGNAFRAHSIPIRSKAGVGDTLNHNFFAVIDAEEKAYFAGLLLADGNITLREHSQPAVRIELQKQDKYILDAFKTALETSNNVTPSRECYRIAVHSLQLVNDLAKLGVVPNKTGRKHFLVDVISTAFQRDFVRGFFDGNGWITCTKCGKYHRYSIGFADCYDCLYELRDFLCDTLNVFPVKIVERAGACMIIFNAKKDIASLLHFMYDNASICLRRKFIKAVDCIGNAERGLAHLLVEHRD